MKRSFLILWGLLVLNSPAQSSRIAPELCDLLASPTHGPRVFARVYKGLHAAQSWQKLPKTTRTNLIENDLVARLDPGTAQDLMGFMSARYRVSFMDQRPSLLPTTRSALNLRQNDLAFVRLSDPKEWPYYLMQSNATDAQQLMQDMCHTAVDVDGHTPGTLDDLDTTKIVTVFQEKTRRLVTPHHAPRHLVVSKHTSLEKAYDYARRQFFKNNRLSRNTLIDRASLRFWTWETMILGHMLDKRRGFASLDPFVKSIVDRELAQSFYALYKHRTVTLDPMIWHISRIIDGDQIPPYQVALDQGTFPQDYETKGRPDLLPQGYEDEAHHRQGGLSSLLESFEIR